MKLHLRFLTILLLFLLNSCKKRETIQVEKDVIVYQDSVYKWSRVSFFDETHSSYIKQTVNLSGGRALFYSTNYLFMYDSTSNTFMQNLTSSETDEQKVPIINNNYCTTLSQGFIGIIPTTTTIPVSYQNFGKINILAFDSSFYDFHFSPQYKTGELLGNDSSMIIPYVTATYNPEVNYLCVKLKKYILNAASSYTTFVVQNYKKIKSCPTPTLNNHGSSYSFSAIGNSFLVRLNNGKNYIINPAFDTIPVNNDWYFKTAFKYNNKQYAVAYTPALVLASTADNGLTWQPEFNLGNAYDYFTYSVVGDKLVAYTANSSINANNMYQVILSSSGGGIKELVNNGLKNVTIRSINMVNNRVFVSTDNGVYERPYSEFIEYK